MFVMGSGEQDPKVQNQYRRNNIKGRWVIILEMILQVSFVLALLSRKYEVELCHYRVMPLFKFYVISINNMSLIIFFWNLVVNFFYLCG